MVVSFLIFLYCTLFKNLFFKKTRNLFLIILTRLLEQSTLSRYC